MFIKELTLNRFKSIGSSLPTLKFSVPNGTPGSGLNIFLGENNTGKSTVFEAFDFLRNSTKKPNEVIVNKGYSGEHASVEIVFTGDIETTIDTFCQDNKKTAFKSKIYQDGGESFLRLQRTTEGRKVLSLWDTESEEFQNPAGIDAPLKGMFETNFVWADTNPQEEAKFGASTITGYLIGEILNSFVEHPEYQTFLEKYDSTFNDNNSNLKQQLSEIEQKTQEVFQNQFGNGNIRFQFEPMNPTNFFKNVKVYIDDGTETTMEEKGSGMQRAIALAMVQVYAEILKDQPDAAIAKPLYLFIDEPEVCLHPKAQEKLFNALLELSENNQIFISTHSPYFLASHHVRNMNLLICTSGADGPEIANLPAHGYFPWSPTWGEINFLAYDMPTVELHNELYGRLQEINNKWRLNEFDDWLEQQGIAKDRIWTKENNGIPGATFNVPLMTFIRNKIHHPENAVMQAHEYTPDELRNSINSMIALL